MIETDFFFFFYFQRDHRDTIFAQAYLTKVKQTLKNDMDRYEKFLKILFEFGKSDHSPVVVIHQFYISFIPFGPSVIFLSVLYMKNIW